MNETVRKFHIASLLPPRILTLAVTGRCNLSCAHCWVEAGPDSTAVVPENVLRRFISDFHPIGSGIRLTGGEPLCHPACLDLIRFARDSGHETISLQTNGSLLDDAAVSRLAELDYPGLALQISLDGASASTHDLVRGKGAFAATLSGLHRLARAGLARRVTIFFTEMRHNLDDIPDLVFLARSLGIPSVICGTVVPCGRGADGSVAGPPDEAQYERLVRRFADDPVFREAYEGIGTVAAIEWTRECTPREGGCTFAENPYITPAGVLFPCLMFHSDPYGVVGVFEKGLDIALAEGASLWKPLREISRSRAASSDLCRECPGRSACEGGCMGRAWASRGDLDAGDDRCPIRKILYRTNPFLSFP